MDQGILVALVLASFSLITPLYNRLGSPYQKHVFSIILSTAVYYLLFGWEGYLHLIAMSWLTFVVSKSTVKDAPIWITIVLLLHLGFNHYLMQVMQGHTHAMVLLFHLGLYGAFDGIGDENVKLCLECARRATRIGGSLSKAACDTD